MTRTNPTRPTRLRMPDPALSALACPVCGNALTLGERGLSCTHGHTFDIAREGYAALLTGSTPPGTGDSKEMITDRLRFQQAGHYDPIGRALAQILDQHLDEPAPLVVDIGGGTGHYLAQVLKALLPWLDEAAASSGSRQSATGARFPHGTEGGAPIQ